MFETAKWIAMTDEKLSPWKTEEYTEEKEEILKKNAQVEIGSALFRKEFMIEKQILQAELSISGLGFYEVYINGKKPDVNRVLTPVVSDYYRLVRYDTYDVTAMVESGNNVVGVELGGGWFSSKPKYWGWQQNWYGNPRMIAQLSIRYADGHTDCVCSDDTWVCHQGCVVESDIYDGEIVDFNRIPEEWKNIVFDCSQWKTAVLAEAPTQNLCESVAPPIRINRVLTPVQSWRLSDTQIVYDFGENGAAVPCVIVKGKKGETVQLNHAEFIYEDGTLDSRSENRALCTDIFTLSERETHICQPRFTWHGYRYMMVTTSSPEMKIISAKSCILHSDLEMIGEFECSNEELNRLHEVYVRTELACLLGVPVDCPQRDERKAWLGDAHVTSEMCLYNFDMQAFYKSFLEDMKIGKIEKTHAIQFICPTFASSTGTSIDWNIAYPIILTEYDERYDDCKLLEYHYQTLKEHVAYYTSICENGLIPPCWFGDWFSIDMPEGMEKVAFAAGSEQHRQNPPFAATMFYCKTLRLAAEIAERLNYIDDGRYYRDLLEQSKKVLLDKYYDEEKGIFGSGGQFLSAFVLSEKWIPEESRDVVFAQLMKSLEETEYHPVVGVVGLRILFDVLCDYGRNDIAYRVLTAEGYPGQLHMLSNGKTTLTEELDGGGSGCHCMWASPDSILYKMLGGITVNRRKKYPVTISPYCPKELSYVSCSQTLREGIVRVNWKRQQDAVYYHIEIPQNITAEITLSNQEKYRHYILGAGTYGFKLSGLGIVEVSRDRSF